MNDDSMPIGHLRETVRQFVLDRDWQQFHAPKNLSMALAIEAAELMELFQWMTVDESRAIRQDKAKYQHVREELADIVCYALAIANELQIDVTTALTEKMAQNVQKYPVERYRGRYETDDADV